LDPPRKKSLSVLIEEGGWGIFTGTDNQPQGEKKKITFWLGNPEGVHHNSGGGATPLFGRGK